MFPLFIQKKVPKISLKHYFSQQIFLFTIFMFHKIAVIHSGNSYERFFYCGLMISIEQKVQILQLIELILLV
jgi:hypothetical protein